MVEVVQAVPVMNMAGRQLMETPQDVAEMVRLKASGIGIKTIAREMGCFLHTVRRYLRGGGWVAYQQPTRKRSVGGLEAWLAERLQQHWGNADVVRHEHDPQHGN